MAIFTELTPQGAADITAHIHNTFIREVLQANVTLKTWNFSWEGTPLRHDTGTATSVPLEGALAVDTSTRATDAAGSPLVSSDSATSIPCNPYGHYLLIEKNAVEQKDMNTLQAKTVALAEQAMKKVDLLCGTAALGGTNVHFQGSRANAAALLDTDRMNASTFIRAKAMLGGSCPKFSDGYFRAFLTSAVMADLYSDAEAVAGFVDKAKYSDPGTFLRAEIGLFHGFRIYEVGDEGCITTNGAGAVGAEGDLYKSMFVGREYMGYTEHTPLTFSGLRPAGDLFDQMVKMYWKGKFGYGRVKETNAIRFESRSQFATNP